MLFEALAAPFYVGPADRYGRRPVLLLCIGLWGLSAVAFGFMTTLIGIIVTRAACECDSTHQAATARARLNIQWGCWRVRACCRGPSWAS